MKSQLLNVCLASFCLIGTAFSFQWPSNIQQCKAADETCIPQALTQLFRHADEIPDLKIPKMEPFVWNKEAVLRTRNPNAPINIVIRNSNTTIYGLKAMEITQVKGFGPDPRKTKFEIKSTVPFLVSVSNYKSTMNLFALPITTEGISNTTITNMEIRQNIDVDVIQKNGKDYIKIKNVRVHIKLNKFSVDFKSKTGNPAINDTINKAINENWREIYAELKQDLEKSIADVIKALISPIFENMPYQEFFLQ
ncbi:circadian clock-controlled protein daywake-like [Sitodiplosis mosellana]|uniref:circadian clock-controlled protein daywake-like n=1 Tax=Sitodiplosis mosellana TaxID=263140 RepID=UPI002444AA8B|nr:circadian clock-controlled protein daywake-like [Sitodiplosis mosellana]